MKKKPETVETVEKEDRNQVTDSEATGPQVGKKEEKRKDDGLKDLKKRLKSAETEIEELNEKNAQLKEDLLRQMADKENLRKRLEREKSDYFQYAMAETLKEFLVVLDNFERALNSPDQEEGKSFREGIELIHKQFRDLLNKQGVQPIDLTDKKFDPRYHQAMATEESDEVDEAQISEELQRGYTYRDRLLRPSFVRVVVPKKS